MRQRPFTPFRKAIHRFGSLVLTTYGEPGGIRTLDPRIKSSSRSVRRRPQMFAHREIGRIRPASGCRHSGSAAGLAVRLAVK